MLKQFTNITAHLYLICRNFWNDINYMVLALFGITRCVQPRELTGKKFLYISVTKFLHGGNDNKLHIVAKP